MIKLQKKCGLLKITEKTIILYLKASSWFRWLHDSFGTNFRMTEVQSAIGRYQLRKLKSWNKIRRRNASIIQTLL